MTIKQFNYGNMQKQDVVIRSSIASITCIVIFLFFPSLQRAYSLASSWSHDILQ